MSKATAVDSIVLTFDLLDLPTAQHRAGLAGLILQIDAMGPNGFKRSPKLVPVIDKLTPTSATITFTRDSAQGIFDELYAAKFVEKVVATKWPGKTPPKPGTFFYPKKDPKTGELKPAPGFAYDVVEPQAPCIARHLQPAAAPWLDLWRQMVWSITRGGNNVRSRVPFTERAQNQPCSEGTAAWADLVDFQKKREKSQFKIKQISGALLLGAQSVNAELVPFAGRVDHNLLLHFWQIVVLTFVPHVVKKSAAKLERAGYVLTIPDVADLLRFRFAFPEILGGLTAESINHTPAMARIDLPAQANLEVLSKLKGATHQDPLARRIKHNINRDNGNHANRKEVQLLATSKAQQEAWGESVHAIESYHMLKLGNNVKLQSFTRVADRPGLIDDYQRIANSFRNPLFRASLMRALIQDTPWYGGMIELFAEYPAPFFIAGEKTPKYLPRFGRDARELFQAFSKDLKDLRKMTIEAMNDEERLKHLSVIVQRLIHRYVERRAEIKTGDKVKDFKKVTTDGKERRVYPTAFREAQQRVCSDAFLAMRSRHDQDFVEFFASSICSTAQYLPPADYQFLTSILLRKSSQSATGTPPPCWEDVKALAMIAVSATAYASQPRELQNKGS